MHMHYALTLIVDKYDKYTLYAARDLFCTLAPPHPHPHDLAQFRPSRGRGPPPPPPIHTHTHIRHTHTRIYTHDDTTHTRCAISCPDPPFSDSPGKKTPPPPCVVRCELPHPHSGLLTPRGHPRLAATTRFASNVKRLESVDRESSQRRATACLFAASQAQKQQHCALRACRAASRS